MFIELIRLRAHLLLAVLEVLDRWQSWGTRLAQQDVQRLNAHIWRARARGE